ncbi:MAG: thioredoxin family protein [Lentisphaeria bacterium]|nr:thioredoxin family protein [Lentisphaeria bacterium]
MKYLLIILQLCILSSLTLHASEWYSSYRKARTTAIQQKKKLLIFFSGSDWCEAGRNLDRDLFKTSTFKRLAAQNYILYNADFPKYSKLGQEAEDQNRSLARRYGIHSFPAVIIIEPRGCGLLVKQVGMNGVTPRTLLRKLESTAGIKSTVPSGQKKKKIPESRK